MNIESLQAYCLTKVGVEECLPFGPENLVFKVGGKMFLLASLDSVPLQFNAKCDPAKAEELREQYACVQPGYHMNKAHWNTITCDGTAPDALLREWIDDSYNLIVASLPKKKREALQ